MALHKPSSKKPSHHSHLSASNDLLKMSTTALTKQPSSRLSLSKIRSSATLVPQKSAICMKAHAIEEVKETEEDEEEVRKEDVGEDGKKEYVEVGRKEDEEDRRKKEVEEDGRKEGVMSVDEEAAKPPTSTAGTARPSTAPDPVSDSLDVKPVVASHSLSELTDETLKHEPVDREAHSSSTLPQALKRHSQVAPIVAPTTDHAPEFRPPASMADQTEEPALSSLATEKPPMKSASLPPLNQNTVVPPIPSHHAASLHAASHHAASLHAASLHAGSLHGPSHQVSSHVFKTHPSTLFTHTVVNRHTQCPLQVFHCCFC